MSPEPPGSGRRRLLFLQRDGEHGARAALPALVGDDPAEGLDKTLGQGQAYAAPLFLRGEEGIEDPAPDFGAYALPRIDDRDDP